MELAQGPQLPAPEWVDAGPAVLDPPDVQEPVLEVDLIPAQGAQLGDAQAVAIGDQDHRAIAVSVSVLSRGADQALDFFGGQVFAGATLGLGNWAGWNCPILRGWRGRSRGLAFLIARMVQHRPNCPISG